MARDARTRNIEQAISREAGLDVIVEERDGILSLDGLVNSIEERQAAEDIAVGYAGDQTIENNLEVGEVLPTSAARFAGGDPTAELVWSADQARRDGEEIDADLVDQEFLDDPEAAAGPQGGVDEDAASDGAEVWVPPSDPVMAIGAHGDAEVLGGFAQDALEDISVEPSAEDRHPGDEALADAIRRELREDGATTDLQIVVAVRRGVAHLRGLVAGPEDAEAAEEVAARVPGVVEVREELEVAADESGS
jgi:osmotically-inducible protein OsmY